MSFKKSFSREEKLFTFVPSDKISFPAIIFVVLPEGISYELPRYSRFEIPKFFK